MKRVGHAVAGTAVLLLTSLGIASGQEKPPSAGQPMPHGGMMMGPGGGMAMMGGPGGIGMMGMADHIEGRIAFP